MNIFFGHKGVGLNGLNGIKGFPARYQLKKLIVRGRDGARGPARACDGFSPNRKITAYN